MRRLAVAAAALLALAGCQSNPTPPKGGTPDAAQAGPRLSFVRAPAGEVAVVVRSEMDAATREGKRVVVYVGATWCEPCRRFHESATSGALDAKLPPTRFVEFDLDADEARLGAAGYSSQYVPLFAIPASDGRSSGKQIEGSIKGPGAPLEIAPRLAKLLSETS